MNFVTRSSAYVLIPSISFHSYYVYQIDYHDLIKTATVLPLKRPILSIHEGSGHFFFFLILHTLVDYCRFLVLKICNMFIIFSIMALIPKYSKNEITGGKRNFYLWIIIEHYRIKVNIVENPEETWIFYQVIYQSP